MKKLTKVLSLMMVTTLSLMGVGCQSAATDSGQTASTGDAQNYKIGVIQLVEHAALDAAYKGFVDGLKEAGFEDGKNITIDYQNAQGDQSNCQTIANKLINDQNNLILAIATPAAQAVANTTKDIPILVTAVTDPAAAKLVASNEAPGGNVSGTSDLTPVKEQIGLITQLVPSVKKVGLLYCSSEANSKFQIEIAKKELEALGLEGVEATVSNSNEIQQVTQSLVGKVEAIYIPTDNMLAAGMATVAQVTTPSKLPVVVGEEGMVTNGGTATYGINYYNLGKLTAAQAVAILKDGKKPAEMPIEYASECTLVVNEEALKAMGIELPQELSDQLVK
ncbi:ABC transporter substrate-binding protein [Cellulosilyticum lentocellum]|uniref:ABC transporter substrate binding protein n=1 Tax=Cellulosilyticum lentocellum (strain ATCC 49066 / DSM 5427 / NCIMB 11756 / RHM5) TaxID=642492 RepID=F2JM23_CELLD|nr:ABC transporter substrate-binding protein [Cellulosilyticum lentocellum]ADZ85803.1 ABC transporter substrate binding protein [Cellulosilyticum lentocellum DSM 5427]